VDLSDTVPQELNYLQMLFTGCANMNIRCYYRFVATSFAASIAAQLEYRANFVVYTITGVVTALTSLLGLSVVVGGGRSIGGWTFAESAVVVGLYIFIEGLMEVALYPNLDQISEEVRQGKLDYVFLRPIDSQFLLSFRNINFFQLPSVFIGAGITLWAITSSGVLTLSNVLIGTIFLLLGYAIIYSIWFMLATLVFWFVGINNVTVLFWGVLRAAEYPITAFPKWLRGLFTFVIPIAFVTTVPAQAFLGRAEGSVLAVGLLIAFLFLVVTRIVWKLAVRSYTSASS
jgi:ABC-2 type transport system permease protein